ncbi:MAG: hypothetical protein WA532_06435, partial [Candidatus Korobacteraceae bacterium]
SSQVFTTLPNPNIRQDYGSSDYDIRQNVTGDFVWDMPFKFGNRALDYALGNWSLSSKVFIRTGTPESYFDTLLPNVFEGTMNVGSIFGGLLPTAVTNLPTSCGTAAVNGATPCASQSMFLPAGTEGTFGNVGRNTLYGPGYFNFDTSLYKPEFPFWLPVSQHRTPARAAPAHTLTHVNLTRPAWPPEAPSLPVWVSPKHGTASCPKRSIAHLSVPLVSSPRF